MLRKRIYKILSVLVAVIIVFSCCLSVSAQHVTFSFVSSKPTVNENSCYLEIVTSSGYAFVFYVSIISYTNISEVNHASFSFNAQLQDDGNLWVWALPQDPNIYVTSVVSVIIDADGSIREGYNRGTSSGVYVGNPYISIKAYNCYGSFTGANAVFSYSNEININNKLDTIINFLQNGNQQIIDNANQNSQQIQQNQNANTDKVIQNQEQNQEEIKNGWQQEENIDSSTTDDYAAKDKELQEATEQGRSEAVSIFNSFGSLFQSDGHLYKGLLSVSAMFTEFMKIGWLSSLLNFSLAIGIFAFVIGTGSSVFKSALEKHEYKKERKYMSSENS